MTKQKDTTWGLNTDQLEELWMTQWQFYELTDLCHLFVAPPMLSYPMSAKFVSLSSLLTGLPSVEMQVGKELHAKIMVLTSVDHCVLGYYAILCGIGLHDLELDRLHAIAN